jgi:phosphoribosylformylglycinamidine synthase subunit PurQ / glutaminase
MRIAIIQFPGTTCIRETSLAVARAGMIPVLFLWNDILSNLEQFAGYILVGGFSYEDRSRAGIIAALHPIMEVLKKQTEQGKPLLGICNGAQILIESGLVPGLVNYQLGLALTTNKRVLNGVVVGSGFYNEWVHIRAAEHTKNDAFTRLLKPNQVLNIPIAHAEGRFQLSNELWLNLKQQGCSFFQYCDEQGTIDNIFPTNPNGSAFNLAAISNVRGNVMAMMPHPERAKEGDIIFQSMRDYIQYEPLTSFKSVSYYQSFYLPSIYRRPKESKELIMAPLTTDNHALTVEKIVLAKDLKASFKRYTHWELQCSTRSLERIVASCVLYNPIKEQLINVKGYKPPHPTIAFLIRAKEDLLGQQKKNHLEQTLELSDLHQLNHSILWLIQCNPEDQEQIIDYLLHSNLLFNPHVHQCHYYSF